MGERQEIYEGSMNAAPSDATTVFGIVASAAAEKLELKVGAMSHNDPKIRVKATLRIELENE